MEEHNLEESVRTRLILAGIRELEEHGTADFSLRRVAQAAQVSCAAPYRHFAHREDLIMQIILYIKNQWQLFCLQIKEAHKEDLKTQICALSVAYIRFWLANPNFRSVLFSPGMAEGDTLGFDGELRALIRAYVAREQAKDTETAVLTWIYGTLMLVWRGALKNTGERLSALSARIERELAAKAAS